MRVARIDDHVETTAVKVTFVHCPNGLQKFSAAVASISAWIKQFGHQTSLILVENDTTEEEFKEQLQSYAPDVIGCTAMSFQWTFIQKIAGWVKETYPTVPIVVGGYHPTGSPEQVIQSPHIDFIVRGEGEGAMQDLLAALETGGDLTKIPNLWSKDPADKTKIYRNEMRPLVNDLDILPDWDRDLFKMDELLAMSNKASMYHGKFHLPAWTGRGCPYKCAYCCNSELMKMYEGKGTFVRRRSPKKAVDELEACIKKYRVEYIEFWDEEFDMPLPQMEALAAEYKARIGLPFSIFKTASLGRLENMQILKEMGCTRMLVGVESGDEEYRRKVLHKPISNEEFIAFFDAVHEMGFETISSNIINMPFETPEMAKRTIELNRRLKPTTIYFFRYVPFEGTEMYEMAKNAGFLPKWHDYWYESRRSGLEQPSMPKDELIKIEEEFRALQAECEERHAARSFQ